MPYLRVLSQFRDNVRDLARGKAGKAENKLLYLEFNIDSL